ncbi:hypothetical protein D3C80_2100660 [compost metagenome]
MCQQALPQGIHIPFVASGQHGDVAFAQFQQFEQPVLDGDFTVGAGLAERRGGFQRFCAVRI